MAAGTPARNELISLRTVGPDEYHSIMCSMEQRIAEIGRAIDELAIRAAEGTDPAQAENTVAARLAELWALLAELDPEVARRVAGYQALLPGADPHRAADPHRTADPHRAATQLKAAA